MKNVINYYYQMNIENIHMAGGIYYFTNQNQSYMFVPYYKDIQTLSSLYELNLQLARENPYYYRIILTKDRLPYIFVDQRCFCLLKTSRVVHDTISFYDLRFETIPLTRSLQSLVRFPWNYFWSQRLDYLEEVLTHIEKRSQNVLPIFLYYMGLAENAIQYVQSCTENLRKTEKDKLTVCHHRIDVKMSVADLYSPLSLVLDYPARDASEYLKSLFFYNEYNLLEVEEYVLSLDFSDFGYSLLFGRMLYPSFFFDLCDDVFNKKCEYQEILKLGERREEYRIFLKEIYYMIRKKVYLEEVRWILRN